MLLLLVVLCVLQVKMPSSEYQRIVKDLATIGDTGGWGGGDEGAYVWWWV